MIGIRVDSNTKIAMGHIMRCMSIAEQMNIKPIFICSERDSTDIASINGYKSICLENDYNRKEDELEALLGVIENNNITTLVVDSYSVTDKYLRKLHEKVKLVYIDDINSFKYDVDLIINYTYMTEKSIYEKWNYTNVKFLIGSKYVPLRKQFIQEPIQIQDVKNIFITTGGTDEYHMIIELIGRLDNNRYGLNIVLGRYYNDKEKLERYIDDIDNVTIYSNVSDIANIMKKNDIAISAGGTTLAELATLGIPTICFSVADNQMSGTKMYDKSGLMIYCGDVRTNKEKVVENIIRTVNKLADDRIMRKQMADNMKKSFDACGATRLAREIEKVDRMS